MRDGDTLPAFTTTKVCEGEPLWRRAYFVQGDGTPVMGRQARCSPIHLVGLDPREGPRPRVGEIGI